MSAETGMVIDKNEPPIVPTNEAPTDIPQAPAAPSPAAGVSPKPATVALATYEDLSTKATRTDDYVVNLAQADGTVKVVRLHLTAIDGPAYDKLIGKCAPTREQAARGMNFNPDTFEPALVGAVVDAPSLTVEEWSGLRTAPNWSGGEWASLVMRCQALCMTGLDVPFSVSG